MESDTTYKSHIGGKGVGRFSWLIAFEKAEIESIYLENNNYLKRSFEFSLTQPGINDTVVTSGFKKDNQTKVRLINYNAPYIVNTPKRAETIAERIIEHCLVYLLSSDCPKIDLIDGDECYNLNSIYKESIVKEDNNITINILNETFNLLHIRLKGNPNNGNKLYLCAHERLVETKDLSQYIVDLDKKFSEKHGFCYIGILRGKYLDDNVDMNRLSFNIHDGNTLDSMVNIITMEQIMQNAIRQIKDYLQDYLQPIAKEKFNRIKDYTITKAPQFRHLLKYMPNEISQIKPDLKPEKLDDELYRIKRKFDQLILKENDKILNDLKKGVITSDEYVNKFKEQIEKINSANGAALSEYIAHRKVILDLLEVAIHKNDDGAFKKENFLHNIIYPMKTTSSDIPYNNHNLWLIDEKLAYCNYISSDIPFNNDPKKGRTDIMVLDNPVAVSDEENHGNLYENIVIFELKRPMRNDYNNTDNPITQLYDYVISLKTNKVTDKNGRTIRTNESTKFYLYAICDITSTLEKILDYHDFSQTPDNLGFYRYNDKLNAHIEILSYDKIINDARKRNKILFEKLGI